MDEEELEEEKFSDLDDQFVEEAYDDEDLESIPDYMSSGNEDEEFLNAEL